jgi:hypothetical protein
VIAQFAMFEVDDYYVSQGESWIGPCPHCGVEKHPTRSDPWGLDPCLGPDYLDDVAHTCCGHGDESRAYVVISPGCAPSQSCEELPDHIVLNGPEALDYFRMRGVGPEATSPVPMRSLARFAELDAWLEVNQ